MAELQQLFDRLCQRTTAYSDWMNRVERLVDGLETEKAGNSFKLIEVLAFLQKILLCDEFLCLHIHMILHDPMLFYGSLGICMYTIM